MELHQRILGRDVPLQQIQRQNIWKYIHSTESTKCYLNNKRAQYFILTSILAVQRNLIKSRSLHTIVRKKIISNGVWKWQSNLSLTEIHPCSLWQCVTVPDYATKPKHTFCLSLHFRLKWKPLHFRDALNEIGIFDKRLNHLWHTL